MLINIIVLTAAQKVARHSLALQVKSFAQKGHLTVGQRIWGITIKAHGVQQLPVCLHSLHSHQFHASCKLGRLEPLQQQQATYVELDGQQLSKEEGTSDVQYMI